MPDTEIITADLSDAGAVTAPETPDTAAGVCVSNPGEPSWAKCVRCPQIGRTCTGWDISLSDSADEVRAYHKAFRAAIKVTVPQVHKPIDHRIGWSTVHDYFGKGGKDPQWVTVSAIHSSLLALAGDRVGQPPLEMPCPLLYADLHARNESLARRLTDEQAENARLAEALSTAEEKHLLTLRDQSAVMQAQLDFAVRQMEAAEQRAADYLRRNDAKSEELKALQTTVRTLEREIITLHGSYAQRIAELYERTLKLATE